ncbi:MAG: glycine cleavage T C-terminal barrel domain-containing protein [Candidatus Eisenbacteria bacterium]|nr:glycine cleavage T C-terminal barrel domain-containing protein [Candidatus Eisenbacteria bacterium]
MSTPLNESAAFGPPAGDASQLIASHRAARDGAALIDRSDRARLVLSGPDALDLLHRTTTADLSELAAGQFATTVIQIETGRILDWLLLWRRTDDLLIVTGPGRGAADLEWLDRMVIMDDVTVRSLDDESALFELSGPDAAAILGRLGLKLPGRVGAAAEPRCVDGIVDGALITVAIARRAEHPECWLVVPRAAAPAVAARLQQAGATPIGLVVDEALRLERGQPLVGRELTNQANPLEARLHASIGFRKGCYPGQEVIARMITYKSVKRILSLIQLERAVTAPRTGSSYPLADGTAAGRITSTAWSFQHAAPLAMGYLRNDLALTGTKVAVNTPDGPVGGQVIDFPIAGTQWN